MTKASRIVIIFLIAHLLGLGQMALLFPAETGLTASVPDGDRIYPYLDVSPPVAFVTFPGVSADAPGAILLPAQVPRPAAVFLPRWLSRAPPAV